MPSDWMEALGILDTDSGSRAAKAARDAILEPARRVLESTGEITQLTVVFQGFVARAQGLHESSVEMTDKGNPHAAFTLLRAYAENAAAILYATDHPAVVRNWWDSESHGIKIGRITNHARTRFDGFQQIYEQLSGFAHPQAPGLLVSSSIKNDDGVSLGWSSAPHFKRPDDQLLAYAWAIELAQASRHLLYEFAQAHRLGYFKSGS